MLTMESFVKLFNSLFMNPDRPKPTEEHESEPSSKIALHFFRHSIRENAPEKRNQDVLLSPEGRILAKSKSSAETNLAQSVAFGSPRQRTQETAGFVMAGARSEITGDESLDELREKLDAELGHGSKIGVDARLDFNSDESTPYRKAFYTAFRGGRYMPFIVEESDAMAESMNDEGGDTYSRMASRIAKIVKKYVAMAPRWENLATDEQKQYTDTLERFLSTHQGVAESFLAKVIEKTKGVEERDRLVKALEEKNGFDFAEGFDLEIRNRGIEKPTIHVTFKKEKDGAVVFQFDEDIPTELLDEIDQQMNG